jgi:steroid delta-isomerase
MPAAEDLRAAVESYIKAFNAGDRDAWLEHFADDARQEDPVGAPVNEGHEAIGAFYDNLVNSFGAPSVTLMQEPIVCGNEVAMAFQAEAGPEDGRVRIPMIIDHLVFNGDGKITSLRAFWDPATITPI